MERRAQQPRISMEPTAQAAGFVIYKETQSKLARNTFLNTVHCKRGELVHINLEWRPSGETLTIQKGQSSYDHVTSSCPGATKADYTRDDSVLPGGWKKGSRVVSQGNWKNKHGIVEEGDIGTVLGPYTGTNEKSKGVKVNCKFPKHANANLHGTLDLKAAPAVEEGATGKRKFVARISESRTPDKIWCSVCGHVYKPSTDGGHMAFESLPATWRCPGGESTGVQVWPEVHQMQPWSNFLAPMNVLLEIAGNMTEGVINPVSVVQQMQSGENDVTVIRAEFAGDFSGREEETAEIMQLGIQHKACPLSEFAFDSFWPLATTFRARLKESPPPTFVVHGSKCANGRSGGDFLAAVLFYLVKLVDGTDEPLIVPKFKKVGEMSLGEAKAADDVPLVVPDRLLPEALEQVHNMYLVKGDAQLFAEELLGFTCTTELHVVYKSTTAGSSVTLSSDILRLRQALLDCATGTDRSKTQTVAVCPWGSMKDSALGTALLKDEATGGGPAAPAPEDTTASFVDKCLRV